MTFTPTNYNPYDFANRRHIGPSPVEMDEMLASVGVRSLDDLIDQTVPALIRQASPLTWAPIASSHAQAHAPFRPVCPVFLRLETSTRIPAKRNSFLVASMNVRWPPSALQPSFFRIKR